MKNTVALAVLALLAVLGIGCVAEGVSQAMSEVTCGERVMSPSDTCTVRDGRSGPVYEIDYPTAKSRFEVQAYVKIGLGAFFLALALLILAGSVRLRRLRKSGDHERELQEERTRWQHRLPAAPPPDRW